MSEQGNSGKGGKFDPTRHLRQIRGPEGVTEYLDVKWRLVWLRSEHPDAQISTEHVTLASDMAIFKAQVTIPGGGSATGYGAESAQATTDFIEQAETKALGRALLALGFGTPPAAAAEGAPATATTPAARLVPASVEEVRSRSFTAPQPAQAPRELATPATPPRPEPIPADTRRNTPRPLRDFSATPAAEPDLADLPTDEPAEARLPVAEDEPPARPLKAAPPLRPAPRPAPAASPAYTREPVEDADDEVVDLANYGWTEFWSWARARGFNDRKSLDAVVGRPTNGMTPLEIRKQIQAKQS